MSSDVTLFLVFIFLIFSLMLGIYLKDILNPLTVLIVPLALQYSLYFHYLYPGIKLSNATNSIYIIAISAFTFGFIWTFLFRSSNSKREQKFERAGKEFKKRKSLFLLIGLIGFFIGAVVAFRFGVSGPGDFFFNLRYSNTVTGENTGGISVYLTLFLQIIVLAMIVFRKVWKAKTWKILFLILLLLISASFTMARTNILATLISVLGAYIYSNRYIYKIKINAKVLVFTFLTFIVIAYLFAVGTGKTNNGYEFFFNYMAYPIVTFDRWIPNFPYTSNGGFTFAFIYKILDSLGLIDYRLGTISDYLGVPNGKFNTFTFIGVPYLDFGVYGIFFIMVLLGVLFGFSYQQVRKGNSYWIILNSILLYPLIMSFYEYQFNLSSYAYYALILLFVYFSSNLVSNKRITIKSQKMSKFDSIKR